MRSLIVAPWCSPARNDRRLVLYADCRALAELARYFCAPVVAGLGNSASAQARLLAIRGQSDHRGKRRLLLVGAPRRPDVFSDQRHLISSRRWRTWPATQTSPSRSPMTTSAARPECAFNPKATLVETTLAQAMRSHRAKLFRKNRNVDFSVAIDPAAEHAFGVERCREVALCVERDDAAVAAQLRHDFHHDLLSRLGDRLALVFDAGADVMRGVGADVVLAPAGCRNRALRVGIRAGADDRRIADAAEALVRHAAGRCASRGRTGSP